MPLRFIYEVERKLIDLYPRVRENNGQEKY